MSLHFITVSDSAEKSASYYRSLETFGIKPVILDYNYNIQNYSKITKVAEFLNTIPLTDVVVLTDSFDVVAVRDPAQGMFSRFEAMGSDMVIACEKTFWGHYDDTRSYFDEHYRGHYPNSGLVMGYAGKMKAVYHHLHKELWTHPLYKGNVFSDQRILSNFMVHGNTLGIKITLDLNGDLMLVLDSQTPTPIPSLLEWPFFVHVPALSVPSQRMRYDALVTQYAPIIPS